VQNSRTKIQTRIGTAGWSIASAYAAEFPGEGTHLQRYAAGLNAVEINSSFYKPHRRQTYERWAASTPPGFRFSATIPKEISHTRRLAGCEEPLAAFLEQVQGLGDRLAVLLLQLPPSLAFDAERTAGFLRPLSARLAGSVSVVCEPRHASWFVPEAEDLLRDLRVARVAADPAAVPQAAEPGGWPGLQYRRLHGSPDLYESAYEPAFLRTLAKRMQAAAGESWCILDNTKLGAALGDALALERYGERA
jgi:uncharacterized protein YecE (DUF72 family)